MVDQRLVSIDKKGVHLVNRFDEEHASTDKHVLPQAQRDARDLAEIIRARTGLQVTVQPVITWWGQFPEGHAVINRILVVHGRQLVDHLLRYQGAGVPRQAIVNALQPGRRRAELTESPAPVIPVDGLRQ